MNVSVRIDTDMPGPITSLDSVQKTATGLLVTKGIKITAERLERSRMK